MFTLFASAWMLIITLPVLVLHFVSSSSVVLHSRFLLPNLDLNWIFWLLSAALLTDNMHDHIRAECDRHAQSFFGAYSRSFFFSHHSL